MKIDHEIARLPDHDKRLLADELAINARLPRKKRNRDDDSWRRPIDIKREFVKRYHYQLQLKQQLQQQREHELSVINRGNALARWQQGMTERDKLEVALKKMIDQFIAELQSPLVDYTSTSDKAVRARKDQLVIHKQTMETIRGLRDLLETLQITDDQAAKETTAQVVDLMKQAERLRKDRASRK